MRTIMTLTGNLTEDLKRALDANMGACAAHTSRLRGLKAIAKSGAITAPVFYQLAGQNPDTIEHDLVNAEQDFQSAKSAYETYCVRMGLPAYATYNQD